MRREWAETYGLRRFGGEGFLRSLEHVEARIGVRKEGIAHNRNNALLLEACAKLNVDVKVAPQAMADVSADAIGAGAIGVGDPFGNKRSMVET